MVLHEGNAILGAILDTPRSQEGQDNRTQVQQAGGGAKQNDAGETREDRHGDKTQGGKEPSKT